MGDRAVAALDLLTHLQGQAGDLIRSLLFFPTHASGSWRRRARSQGHWNASGGPVILPVRGARDCWKRVMHIVINPYGEPFEAISHIM